MADSVVENERIKLAANYLNGLAIAIFAIDGIAPIASVVYRDDAVTDLTAVSIGAVICFAVSFALHSMARRVLKGLRP